MRRSNEMLLLGSVMSLAWACSGQGQTPADAVPPAPSALAASPEALGAPPASARSSAVVSAPSDPSAPGSSSSTAPSSPLAAEIDDAPRITSIRYKTWIWPRPRASGRFLGYIRVGSSVKLKSPELVRGADCPGGFYAIEPHGFVCKDKTVTTERTTPFLAANAHTLPADGPFPYRFALSNGAPMYARLPTPKEQKRERYQYGKAGTFVKLGMFQAGHEHLARTSPILPTHSLPLFLKNGRNARGRRPMRFLRRDIPHGSMLAFREAFDFGGRTFLLSSDLTVVPADRVRIFEPSQFHGTPLGSSAEGISLPIAFMRKKARPQYALVGGVLTATGKNWPVRSWVSLTGKQREQDGAEFHEVDGGLFIAAADATVIEDYGKYPFGVKKGEKWMLVSIMQGTLIAYDGLTPVYATLISPGQGGWPRKGGNLVKDSTTPLGTYHMTFKDRAATMSPEFGEDRSFWIADVPFTQYFSPPFALHAAYWHEKFGELMSGGCVNASPIDAAWLFSWSDPQVPAGWQGATGSGSPENGGSTAIVIRR